jgi:hypothetical protein
MSSFDICRRLRAWRQRLARGDFATFRHQVEYLSGPIIYFYFIFQLPLYRNFHYKKFQRNSLYV